MSDSNQKEVPPPVPQAAPYAQRFAPRARTEDAALTEAPDKDVAPAPQGAPAANFIADAKSD